MKEFILKPFADSNSLADIELTGTIDRIVDNMRSLEQPPVLRIEYRLSGDLKAIAIPPPAAVPSRRDKLWEATCFELFLGIPGERSYWEFNLSPTGDWNIFYLEDYRQGLREEFAVTSLPLQIDRQPNLLSLSLELDLSKIIAVARSIEVAVTTVIAPQQGEISYWAVTHCGAAADFHLRDSFTISVR